MIALIDELFSGRFCDIWYIIHVIRRGILNRIILFIFFFLASVSTILLIPGKASSQLYWDVTVAESIGDTLTIHVIPSELISCGELTCPCWAYYWLRISPCPLFVECEENKYSLYRQHGYVTELRILNTETYEFSGEYHFFGSYSVSGRYDDCSQECEINITMETKFFPEDYVSTSESSWGRIKALYSID